ncbi:MAG: DUF2442 domain-containing protein [Clostridium sp.]
MKNKWDIYQVIPTDDFTVYLYFEDGKIKLFNIGMIELVGVFEPLKDVTVFKDTCTVLNRTLAWSLDKSYDTTTCIDLDADVLYEQCPIVDEPWHLWERLNPNSICPKCGEKFDGCYCDKCNYWIEEDKK